MAWQLNVTKKKSDILGFAGIDVQIGIEQCLL
jgi:hypothetical protein